jgi:tetratricopeptide (TPR) repeat protein
MEAAPMRIATLALLLAVVLLGARPWGQESSGNRAYRRGDYEKAAERYREALERRGVSPRILYNLGTALYRLGDSEHSRERLVEALQAQSPELRARAFYNLGNALARAPEGGTPDQEELRAAIDAYRRSLLLDPGRDDVRWNLELAMQRLEEMEQNMPGEDQQPNVPPRPPGSGENQQPREGGSGSTAPQPGDEPPREVPDASEAPLPPELAEQILRAVEERERGLQREKLRRQRTRSRGPDW